MKYKFFLTTLLPLIGVSSISTVGLSLSLTSCSTSQITSIFDRINNAIKAIGSLNGGTVGSNQTENDVVSISKIKEVVAEAFSLDLDKFHDYIQTFNIYPIEDNSIKQSNWIVTILLKSGENTLSWPNELIKSDKNIANKNAKDPFYYATSKYLSFEVTPNFKKISVNAQDLENSKDSVATAINMLNGSNIYSNNANNDLNNKEKSDFIFSLSRTNSQFVPSSVDAANSVIKYNKIDNQAIDKNFVDLDKYNYNLELCPGYKYVFVDDANEIVEKVSFSNIVYDQVDISLNDNIKKLFLDSVNKEFAELGPQDSISLAKKMMNIENSVKQDPIFKDLLPYFKAVEYNKELWEEYYKPKVTYNSKDEYVLTIHFVFKDNVNIKSFIYPSPEKQLLNEDMPPSSYNPWIYLETDPLKDNWVNALDIEIIYNVL